MRKTSSGLTTEKVKHHSLSLQETSHPVFLGLREIGSPEITKFPPESDSGFTQETDFSGISKETMEVITDQCTKTLYLVKKLIINERESDGF